MWFLSQFCVCVCVFCRCFVVWDDVVYVFLLETHCSTECCGYCFLLVGILPVVGCMCVVCCRGT
jgi:hypothetical protein